MMTVCSGEEVFATAEDGAIEGATLDLGEEEAIAGATVVGWNEGAIGAVLGCGVDGAIREIEGGAGGAKRRVNGSRRRRGAGVEMAGATTELG